TARAARFWRALAARAAWPENSSGCITWRSIPRATSIPLRWAPGAACRSSSARAVRPTDRQPCSSQGARAARPGCDGELLLLGRARCRGRFATRAAPPVLAQRLAQAAARRLVRVAHFAGRDASGIARRRCSLECNSRAADGPSKGAPLAPYPLSPAAIDAVVGNEVGNVFFLARELLIRAAHLRDPREC